MEREKDKEAIKAMIHSMRLQIDAFPSEYEQSISGEDNLIYREVGSGKYCSFTPQFLLCTDAEHSRE